MSGKTKLILVTVFFLVLLGTGLSWGRRGASPEAITAGCRPGPGGHAGQDRSRGQRQR